MRKIVYLLWLSAWVAAWGASSAQDALLLATRTSSQIPPVGADRTTILQNRSGTLRGKRNFPSSKTDSNRVLTNLRGDLIPTRGPLTGGKPITSTHNPGIQNVGVPYDDAQAEKPAQTGEVRNTRVPLLQTGGEPPERLPEVGPNLAKGKNYTLEPAPNYRPCTDPNDKSQLTDGVYTLGHFWTQWSTVGWEAKNVIITIDLGKDEPIKGISYHTAAGVADVRWPQRILVFVSPNGHEWFDAGNLVALNESQNKLPNYGRYVTRHIWTETLDTHGRYVKLLVKPRHRSYVFVDELEVWGGPRELLNRPYSGEAVTERELIAREELCDIIRKQFERELSVVMDVVATLPKADKIRLLAEAEKLQTRVDVWTPPSMETLKAILPIDHLEVDIFRLLASSWRVQKKPTLRIWNSQRWDMLNPYAEPNTLSPPTALVIHLMNNEWRAGTINLTNASDEPLKMRIRVTGLPGGDNPPYLSIHEVLTVGTRHFVPVSAALPLASREGDDYTITVPSGMTRQVWLSFKPIDLPAKTHAGCIEFFSTNSAALAVPLNLVVYPLRFPEETTLQLGGWDYSDLDRIYGITRNNRAAVIQHLQEHNVNTPWASGSVLWAVKVDEQGNVSEVPNTSRFDGWVRSWPKAKTYLVFLDCNDYFFGSRIGTPEFTIKVGGWARFWAQHMRELGHNPHQLGVLINDEPRSVEQYNRIVAWATAIKAAAPEIVIWENPLPTDGSSKTHAMLAAVDVICPLRDAMERDQSYRNLILEAQRAGKELWLYNAIGPARTFDPFSYYLAQEWHAFALGSRGSHFWSFSDNGGVSCWNEYPAQKAGPYCPSYIDASSVTTSKYMEAIREGTQDYEYLVMLQARVNELENLGVESPHIEAAKRLVIEGPKRVLAGEVGSNYRWDAKKDRAVQDEVRIEILKTLVALKSLPD